MASDLSIVRYGYNNQQPSAMLNSIFASTVNTAAKTLMAVSSSSTLDHPRKWRTMDHVRFIHMLLTWLTVWVLRVLIDYFPSIETLTSPSNTLLRGFSSVGSLDLITSSSSSSSSFDVVPYQGSDVIPVNSLARALSHVLALLNELPANTRNYQFAISMADKIVDENTRNGHTELLYVNRIALSSAFSRTSERLYRSLQRRQRGDDSVSWPARLMSSIPLGSYLKPLVSMGVDLFLPSVISSVINGSWGLQKQPKQQEYGREREDDVAAEKYAQELLWITSKMRSCGAVDEALVQWSLASGLASLALGANPRIQGFILRISVMLFGDVNGVEVELSDEVKLRLLLLWVPVFCYADNGLSYPVLSGYEKAEMEKVMDSLIASLPDMDQEVVLTNWFQDFTVSNSDWPNLQYTYDRWCHSTRNLVVH